MSEERWVGLLVVGEPVATGISFSLCHVHILSNFIQSPFYRVTMVVWHSVLLTLIWLFLCLPDSAFFANGQLGGNLVLNHHGHPVYPLIWRIRAYTGLLLKVLPGKAADSCLCKGESLPFRCSTFCSNSVDPSTLSCAHLRPPSLRTSHPRPSRWLRTALSGSCRTGWQFHSP